MSNLADINQLSIIFQNTKQTLTAVDEISFSLSRGETLALLGESGCGKSLTSLALMRLLPNYAMYGKNSEINIEKQDLLELPEYLMRLLRGKRLAIIFQEPMTALNPVLTIEDQLRECLPKQQQTNKQTKDRLIELLNEVEIPNPQLRLCQYPHQLSGGQKQRIVIAMALAANPELLIADEPTTALDVSIQAQILALLKKLQHRHQMAILLITHDLGVVKAIADRVCLMYAGQIVEQAKVADFFSKVLHPYAQQLLASLPSFEKRNYYLQTIPGSVPSLGAIAQGCRFHSRCAHAFSRCSNEEPVLQNKEDRLIRCHLYPGVEFLPILSQEKKNWQTKTLSNEIVLEVNQLKVYFSHKKRLFRSYGEIIKAVDGLSLKLFKGKTLALVGESGCGKTTASRALLRLLPITSGNVIFHGQNVRTLKRSALTNYRKKVQIIFQDPFSSMNPRLTVGEIIAEGMHAQGWRANLIAKKQQMLLDQVNLPASSLNRYPHQFSGGQRQRICIARALATEPEILICDEPTSALDISIQAQILNLLKELQQENGLAYLFITHNMSVVAYMADEVQVMREGQIVEAGSCEQLLHYPQQQYTQQLLANVLS